MERYAISEAEWKIMQQLWGRGSLSYSEIAARLANSGWSESTMKTLLRRLVEKGCVTADKSQGKSFRYSAAVGEQECKLGEARSFLDRVFDGSVSLFVSAFAKESSLTLREQEELRAILDKMEEGERN